MSPVLSVGDSVAKSRTSTHLLRPLRVCERERLVRVHEPGEADRAHGELAAVERLRVVRAALGRGARADRRAPTLRRRARVCLVLVADGQQRLAARRRRPPRLVEVRPRVLCMGGARGLHGAGCVACSCLEDTCGWHATSVRVGLVYCAWPGPGKGQARARPVRGAPAGPRRRLRATAEGAPRAKRR